MSKNGYLLVSLLLAILICLTAATAVSCGSFKTFSFNQDPYHFSFEYPADYYVAMARVEPSSEPEVNYAQFVLGKVGEDSAKTFIEFFRFPNRMNSGGNATSALEDQLSIFKPMPTFKLLERTTVEVEDTRGEEVAYTTLPLSDPFYSIFRQAFFGHGGLVWSVRMTSDNATANADKSVFEHMLKTIRIYD